MLAKNKAKKSIKKVELAESSETGKMMVLLEDMRDGIKLVAEGHSILERKMEEGFKEAKKDLDDFKKETRGNFKIVFEKFEEIDKKFESHDQKFKSIDQNFKIILEYLSRIDDEITGIKSEMEKLRKDLRTKVDADRFAMLEERVTALEVRQMILRDEGKKKYNCKK